jgi:hypothetical protein
VRRIATVVFVIAALLGLAYIAILMYISITGDGIS